MFKQEREFEVNVTYPFAKVIQNLDLDQCLMVEPLLVADDLDRNRLTGLMVPAI